MLRAMAQGLRVDDSLSSGMKSLLGNLPERFSDKGFSLYLVGGVVRDLKMGHRLVDCHDVDMTTDAKPSEIREALKGWADALWTQGEKFGTIGARPKDGQLDVEITTHRAESYLDGSRKPEVSFTGELESDLARRDFTINAMAIDLQYWTLVDPFNGERDLRERILRTPLDPSVTLADDPLRMLRTARFAARYQMELDPVLRTALSSQSQRLSIVSRERIRDEMLKLLSLPDPSGGLRLMVETGIADTAAPGVDLGDVEAPKRVPVSAGPLVRLGAMFVPTNSPEAVRCALSSWRLSRSEESMLQATLRGVWDFQASPPRSLPEIRRWLVGAEPHADVALILAGLTADVSDIKATVAQLRRDEPDLGTPPLDGDSIMRLMGVEPGPIVGDAQRHLSTVRFEMGPMTTEEAEEALLLWRAMQRQDDSWPLPLRSVFPHAADNPHIDPFSGKPWVKICRHIGARSRLPCNRPEGHRGKHRYH